MPPQLQRMANSLRQLSTFINLHQLFINPLLHPRARHFLPSLEQDHFGHHTCCIRVELNVGIHHLQEKTVGRFGKYFEAALASRASKANWSLAVGISLIFKPPFLP